MEADRMVNSRIAQSDLQTEFSVVRNEMEIGENNASRVLWQRMAAAAFDWHNYGKSTIGARSDVENVRIENLQAFYRRYYQPDNAVLVLAGSFDRDAALKLVESTFGRIPRPARSLPPAYTQDPVQDGAREVRVNRVGETPLLGVLYHTAPASHPDATALAALAEILGDTPNGRLHKALVESGQAVSVGPWNFALDQAGYIIFMAELAQEQPVAAARQTLRAQLENLARQPITAAELERAKIAMLADTENTLNSPQALALRLTDAIANGDLRLFFLHRDRVEALQREDVQRVAENYFKDSNATWGEFIPTKQPQRAAMPAPVDLDAVLRNYQGRAALEEGEAFDASPANIEDRTRRLTLPGGMRLALLSKKNRGATVVGQLRLHMGDAASLMGQSTASDLAAEMLMRGAGNYSRAELSALLERLNTQMSVSGDGQQLLLQFVTRRKHLAQVLELVRDVLRQPRFAPDEFALVVQESATALEASRSDPNAMARQAVAQALEVYPPADVRATQTVDQALAELRSTTLEDVRRFHARFYGADHAEFALVGDFDAQAAPVQIEALLGDWKSPAHYTRLPYLARAERPGQTLLQAPDKANAFYLAALPLVLRDDMPDFVPLILADEVLGGGSKSRLSERLRQQDGISYGAGSNLSVDSFDPVAMWRLYALYAPDKLAVLRKGVEEELSRLLVQGITAEELTDAKKSLLEQRKLSRTRDSALAGALLHQLATGRTMGFSAALDAAISAVSLEEVNAALRRHLRPELLLQVYAGDFAKFGVRGLAP
jgi:zinc protease